MIDNWQEIWHTIRQNRLRTFLTGFSVAWGIFMLVLLLGSGSGLENGVKYQFSGQATNFALFWGGQVSKAYKGTRPGKGIAIENRDSKDIRNEVSGIAHEAPRKHLWLSAVSKYGKKTIQNDLVGVTPDYIKIKNIAVVNGRWLNELDMNLQRNVGVMKKASVEKLFGEEDPIGKTVEVKGMHFRIVGVYDPVSIDREWGGSDHMYVPIPLVQRASSNKEDIGSIQLVFSSTDLKGNLTRMDQIKGVIAANHQFDVTDTRAVGSNAGFEDFERFRLLFAGIKIFLWIVGIGTLMAGVVGVSNIMLIVAKERTKEIGLRKALGATSGSIIRLFIQESVFITFVSGYLGLILGLGLMELVNKGLEQSGGGSEFFKSPEVDFMTALGAVILIVVAGALAGYFPARIAAKTTPIEALRDE